MQNLLFWISATYSADTIPGGIMMWVAEFIHTQKHNPACVWNINVGGAITCAIP